jgi:putative phage-type endonuclease
MNTHELVQGSPEWHQHRANYFNASDAPAMMGVSPYKTRSQLLHERATGVTPEVDASTQKRFDDGHRFEALARALAEEIIGEELYPIVGSDGKYSASFDGLTMLEDVAFEHKTLNTDICNAMSVDDLHPMYHIQMEQQLMVSGAAKCLFLASKWDDQGDLIDSRHFWYEQNLELRQKIVDGWSQFEKDIAEYSPREISEKPIVADIENLPAIAVQIRGEVVTSNLPVFKSSAEAFLAQINTNLQTDEDFAIAEKVVKHCEKVEKELDLTKRAAIAQTASIDDLMRTIDAIQCEFRAKRLQLDKLVKSQKEAIRTSAILGAQNKFREHVADLENQIKPIRLVVNQPDFAGAAKNKRTLSSLHDAIDTALAHAKVEASNLSSTIFKKLDWYKSEIGNYGFLFSDLQVIVYKEAEDFMLLVKSRIEGHKKAEEERLESERKRIEAEAGAKAQREAEEKAEAERKRIAEQERHDIAEAIENRAAVEQKVYRETDIESITDKPAYQQIEDQVERLIASLVLRIESGDMTIRDALMVAYQAGTERAVAA